MFQTNNAKRGTDGPERSFPTELLLSDGGAGGSWLPWAAAVEDAACGAGAGGAAAALLMPPRISSCTSGGPEQLVSWLGCNTSHQPETKQRRRKATSPGADCQTPDGASRQTTRLELLLGGVGVADLALQHSQLLGLRTERRSAARSSSIAPSLEAGATDVAVQATRESLRSMHACRRPRRHACNRTLLLLLLLQLKRSGTRPHVHGLQVLDGGLQARGKEERKRDKGVAQE